MQSFITTSDSTHLKNLAKESIRKKHLDIVVLVLLVLLLMYLTIYSVSFCFKSKDTDEIEDAPKPSKFWIFLHLSKKPLIRKTSFYAAILLSIISGYFLANVRSQTNTALDALRYLDCSYHRILQYLHYGKPQSDWELSPNYLQNLPRTSPTRGFFGLTGYGYFLNTIKEDLNKLQTPKSDPDSKLKDKAAKLWDDYEKMKQGDAYQIESPSKPRKYLISDAIRDLEFNSTYVHELNIQNPFRKNLTSLPESALGNIIAADIKQIKERIAELEFAAENLREFNIPLYFEEYTKLNTT